MTMEIFSFKSTKVVISLLLTSALWFGCASPQKASKISYTKRKEGRNYSAVKRRPSSFSFAQAGSSKSGKVSGGSDLPCPDYRHTDVRARANKPRRQVYISGMPEPDEEPVTASLDPTDEPQPQGAPPAGINPDRQDALTLLKNATRPEAPTLRPLYFIFDEDELTAEDWRTIRTAADYIKYGYVIRIEGHTDNYGTTQYNEQLSLRRALRIKRLMVEKTGVPADKIVAVGLGEAEPVVANSTPEKRQLNRRVEIYVVNSHQ
jgi:outer membrane protein OmpA-like peptidoglycan-associated protein